MADNKNACIQINREIGKTLKRKLAYMNRQTVTVFCRILDDNKIYDIVKSTSLNLKYSIKCWDVGSVIFSRNF